MEPRLQIPEIEIELRPQSEEARKAIGFKFAEEKMGRRSKIGGVPDFIQEAEVPMCSSCNKTMTFYGQLDSVGDNICIADCGMVYVYICFGCYSSKSF